MPRFEIRGEKEYYKSAKHLVKHIVVIDNKTNKVVDKKYLYVQKYVEQNPRYLLQIAPRPVPDSALQITTLDPDADVVCQVYATTPDQINIVGQNPKEVYTIEETADSIIITNEEAEAKVEDDKPK